MVNTASKWGGVRGAAVPRSSRSVLRGREWPGQRPEMGVLGTGQGQERSGVWPRGWRITVLGSCRPLRAKALPLSDWDRTPSTSC